jgi:hypothetical protein
VTKIIDLGYRPRAWQRDCHQNRRRFTVLALHRRAGKTELGLRELVDKALRFERELGLFFYIAPLLKQAKAIAWLRLKQITLPLQLAGLAEVNESELWVRLTANGATIRVYGADSPDRMRGVRLDGVVLDEVAQMSPEVWDDILQPALSDRLGWSLFIGTPKGVNLFSQLFYAARDKPDWHAALYTVHDTDSIPASEVQRLQSEMSEMSWRREYLCDFSAAGDEQLISLADVEEASRRHVRRDQYDFAPVILGVDPARFGDDRSVIAIRQGLVCRPFRVYTKVDNMALAAYVAQAIEDVQADAVFVDAGNGAGVIDKLRQLGHEVVEVHFGGRPGKPRYVNKRAEMWYELRDWLMAGGCIPNDVALKQDLAAPTYKFDSQDRVALESKDELKARGLPSPDLGDALALTFAFPVVKERDLRRQAAVMAGHRANQFDRAVDVTGYDPLAAM